MTSSVPELVKTYRSGVIHIQYLRSGQRVGSGSGFLTRDKLVTNYHVFRAPADVDVRLGWQPSQDVSSRCEIELPYNEFEGWLISGSDESQYDFAILDAKGLPLKELSQFEVDLPKDNLVGREVVFLGFPLEHTNLVCHSGMISSIYENAGVEIIQIDASVNQSNSGGPLIDLESEQVIGVITRKGTGLSKLFNDLMKAFDNNIQLMSAGGGADVIMGGGISLHEALISSQSQMKQLAAEILRSANVGIGYAFSSAQLLSDNAMHDT